MSSYDRDKIGERLGSGKLWSAEESDMVILLDGDVPAYRSAAAANGNQWKVTVIKGGKEHKPTFVKYKKEADELASSLKLSSPDMCKIEKVSIPEPVTHALHNVKLSMEDLMRDLTFSRVYAKLSLRSFLTRGDNFRNDLKADYKGGRDERPEHLEACKDYIEKNWYGEWEDGFEADDLIGIAAMQAIKDKKQYVIVTTDKDLDMIPGLHYDPVKKEFRFIDFPMSYYHFYKQLLMGDATDKITGIPGCGPKTAEKILGDADSSCVYKMKGTDVMLYTKAMLTYEINLYRRVRQAYSDYIQKRYLKDTKKKYKDLTMEDRQIISTNTQIEMELNANLLWILREPEVLWSKPSKRTREVSL